MYPRQSLPINLVSLARQQAGMITTRQMLDGGLSRTVIRRLTGPWTRLMYGLYCTEQPTWKSAVWAGLLAGGASASVGGAAALYLDEILRDPPELVTVWSTESRANLALGEWSILLRRGERTAIGTVPRTRVEESLLDMADHAAQDDLTDAVVRSFTNGRTTASRLLEALTARGRNAHRRHLHDLCQHAARGIESALEWHFSRSVIAAHGLPEPILQPKSDHGRSDGHWPEFKLRFELDGRRDHTDASRDWYRDNAHKIHNDEDTLHYGWNSSTKQACRTAAQLEDGLRKLGWPGRARPCRAVCDLHTLRAA
ncbi:type IV toxin-antitoxin system AbiEi family antitoxin domain-containing protein [Tessaracoccus sp. ZS01]|uniref:type IV toxin-antitoxin system AbiEi family antitoxin domain-containing protein n=1 Tax=Tessaracoccus sp. ZS01 TaxID=1906324 RepID=UPI00117D572A|nr:type IV toxin-antitoxin system AbiEi family antitoxin domain-containing protein [Tessaracoccus sp. ZS01]